MAIIDETIRAYHQELPMGSQTAKAIAVSASLTTISQFAAEEGLHALAALLFVMQQEELKGDDEPDYAVRVTEATQHVRRNLPATSKTAAALDRRASWTEISQCAEEEGLRQHPLTAVLCVAQQERLRQRVIVHAPARCLPRKQGVHWSRRSITYQDKFWRG